MSPLSSPPRNPRNDPPPSAGQLLLLQQAQEIASLTDHCKTLTSMLASAGQGGPKKPREPAEKARLRGMTLRAFCSQCYLPERGHSPDSPTTELAKAALDKLLAAFGRELLVEELVVGSLKRFRGWFSGKIAEGLSPATANLHLRQLRAIWNHAARRQWTDSGRRWRAIQPPPPMEFFEEPPPNVDAWRVSDLDRIEEQVRNLTGMVGPVPADVFWTAWALVFRSLGCRVTAMMLCRRTDYDSTERALLLRCENQKQNKDQRIALPPRAAAAVERLLAAHDHERIFGCWPFDPPEQKTGRRKWRVLSKHFMNRLVTPCGLTLPKGVKTRQFRRTAATIVAERGGDATELLGHASRKTTERYKDRKRRPICRQSLLIPEGTNPQKRLF